MLMSVFTPTNTPEWLGDCYKSLLSQTYTNWEWVLVPNGDNQAFIVDYLTKFQDSRIKIIEAPVGVTTIGGLKRAACFACEGAALVELDHDDELLSDCLMKLKEAFEAGAGFVYSDSLSWHEGGGTDHYNEAHGWEGYMIPYRGFDRMCYKSFKPSPRSFSEIFYAPNHVRAWDADVYRAAGGHDYEMEICDDHDLLCRTYLATNHITYIPECLYAYRLHDRNTSRLKSELIQRTQSQIYNRHIEFMVQKWCEDNKLRMIDLGGAHGSPGEPWEALDKYPGEGVTIVADVLNGLPFAANSIGAFRAHDFLEHIESSKIPQIMNDLYRCLADGGWVFASSPAVAAPDGSVGFGAYQDPTHKSFWVPNNWWYYTDTQYARFVPEIQSRFQLARLWHGYPSPDHKHHRIPYVQADLLAVKGDSRPPGILRI